MLIKWLTRFSTGKYCLKGSLFCSCPNVQGGVVVGVGWFYEYNVSMEL